MPGATLSLILAVLALVLFGVAAYLTADLHHKLVAAGLAVLALAMVLR